MINLTKKTYTEIQETLFHETLENGLEVYILPKKGFHKTYATLSTPLGSNVTDFTFNNTPVTIPLGVAHFLEHKLFDKNGTDISEEFALQHAHVNAYTMNNRTTYLFSCTDLLNKNLQTLKKLVFEPDFTKEGIEKEIGIITQEIKMYADDPNTIIYMGALKNMYQTHPVRNDILGTEESINQINKEILDTVHSAFYNPSNMILFITGNIQVEEVLETVRTTFVTNTTPAFVEIKQAKETDKSVQHPLGEIEHEVYIPNALIGFKQEPTDLGEVNYLRKELTYSIYFDMLLGKSSTDFQKLLEEGYVNDTFGIDITLEQDYGYVMLGSNTFMPDAFYHQIQSIIQKEDITFDIETFKRAKKQIIGGFISALNSLEYIANQFTKYYYVNSSLFSVLDIAKGITLDDIYYVHNNLQAKDIVTTYTVFPKKNDGE